MVSQDFRSPASTGPVQRITFQQLASLQRATQERSDRPVVSAYTPPHARHREREERCPFLEAVEEPFVAGSLGPDLEAEPMVPLELSRPVPCSYLRPGQSFKGKQSVQRPSQLKTETWTVTVHIDDVDWERGAVRGSMAADDVPHSHSPVQTSWEGEVIDNVNHSFTTSKWGAEGDVDRRHWRKFAGYQPLKRQVARFGGRCPQLAEWPTIFMRWKETSFLNDSSEECGLTIAGFYYVALDRQTGCIEGFYFDAQSTPSQRVDLRPVSGQGGHPGLQSFGAFQYQ